MKYLLISICLFINTTVFAQETVEEYIKIGIEFHDAGNYKLAIEAYLEALKLDENSALAHYEISYTYIFLEQYENAMQHADKVIELNDKYLKDAYVNKGNCLDHLGNPKEAIKTYNEGIKKIGGDYMLYYNLALTHYNLGNLTEAESALVSGIKSNPNHPSSHLLLGRLMNEMNNKVQSILCLHYFLFLEPSSTRSPDALNLLMKQFSGNVEKKSEKETTIFISQESLDKKSEFGSVEMMMSLIIAGNNIEKNKDKTKEELFISNTESYFKFLGELKKKKSTGLWWEFYIPFDYDLAKTKHLETYCYYITQSTNTLAEDWLNANGEKLEEFSDWLDTWASEK